MKAPYKIQAPNQREHLIIKFMVFIGICTIVNFLYWFFQPEYKSDTLLYWLLGTTLIYAVFKTLYMWYHYINISLPKPPEKSASFSVDIFTTFFPGEPYDMIVETLEAVQKIVHPHTSYLCDEANDPYLKEVCKKLGVIHVTRNHRTDAKAGNINNALRQATGEICVILDPDHIPEPHFLDSIVPHFSRPEIGFVQIVQSYYNLKETLVAKGAAEQTFQFYGPMMMTMNSYGTVNAIGANCTFRRKALDGIGGHAPGLAEDMHTAMLLYAQGWKSVYVPMVLAKGLAPSNLTAYYKQQLKWARGTFDLLFKVYPKVFKKFTFRQKLHYALSPLHYLIGFIYFINFLIPILSLIFSKSPWNGNIIFFGLITLPVIICTVLIRAYIQKWVIEKKEQGFHIMGGLLQITTWWIYSLGFIYTVFGKKIPYLPTPKGDDENSNFRLIVPNAIIGFLSLFSVFYGLNRDFTPFMAMMGLFAFLNAFFMFFSIYLASRTSNRNRILRNTLQKKTILALVRIKHFFADCSDTMFKITRSSVLPVLIISLILLQIGFKKMELDKWENAVPPPHKELSNHYLGIFHPSNENGKSNLEEIAQIEREQELKFDLISLYVAWGDKELHTFPKKEVTKIHSKNAVPLITWEPWASTFERYDTIPGLQNEKNMLHYIDQGHFDAYIEAFALELKSSQRPVFLRFAHEFDNPSYPWSATGENTSKNFKDAWIHIHDIFKRLGVTNVIWVWNPWKSKSMHSFYPGDQYVDWIGITGLNYGALNQNKKSVSFHDLYKPYHDELKKHSKKPVMIAEFGSLKLGADQQKWMRQAVTSINYKFQEIDALVFFNSSFDKNIPQKKSSTPNLKYLNWQLSTIRPIDSLYNHGLPEYLFDHSVRLKKNHPPKFNTVMLPPLLFKGIGYKKGQNWKANNYVLSRNNLEKDFQLMKEFGINAIRYEQGIYDNNVIALSKEADLNLFYSFWIPNDIDFISDSLKLKKLKKKIITTIIKLKNEKTIIAWNIGNTVLKDISHNFNAPVDHYQRIAYFNWLQELLSEIKKVDSQHPLILEITASRDNFEYFKKLSGQNLPLDYFGFRATGKDYYSAFQNYAKKQQLPFLFTAMDMENFVFHKSTIKSKSIFLDNWQDQWENRKITFDGLLDRKGRKKTDTETIGHFWNNKKKMAIIPKINMIKPSIPITPLKKVTYTAALFLGNQWIYPEEYAADMFEWALLKTDSHGNAIAVKELGKGPKITFKIPKDYYRMNYEIVVSLYINDLVTMYRTTLNTPLHSSMAP